MGLLDKFLSIFDDEEPPKLSMETQAKIVANPVEINPTPKVSLRRQLGRLYNLYNVSNPDAEVKAEIERYKQGLRASGVTTIPRTAEDVEKLIKAIEG
jgi:hypothetical protein